MHLRSFICIDVDNSFSIQLDEWQGLMKQVFYGRAYEDKMETIFYQLDINEQNCVTLDEFFEATNIIRNTKQLALHMIRTPQICFISKWRQ